MAELTGVGAALPSWRLPRSEVATAWGGRGGKGTLPVCADDEDTLTLAWRAADRALTAAGVTAEDVDALMWGTTRPPYSMGPSHAVLAAAVGLPATSGGALFSGSAHAGVEALLAAWDAVAAGSARRVLVVASEDPRPGLGTVWERNAGAGAAACVVTSGADGPALLAARATRTNPVLDRYTGERVTRDLYDSRLYREEVFLPSVTAIGAALGAESVTAWSLPDPDGRLGAAAARRLGAAVPASAAGLGDTGAAAALLGAVEALAAPGTVGLVGHGGGRTTGVLVEVSAPVPGAGPLDPLLAAGRQASYAEVLRARGDLAAASEPMPMGVPPGSAAFVRGGREVLQLLGARCVDCGTVSTPPSLHPHCYACGGAKSTDVALARTGTVYTFAVNHTMPAPFVAPLPLAVVDLDDGARVMLQVVGGGSELAIESRVRLVLRRYAVERGVSVYGYKAELAEEA